MTVKQASVAQMFLILVLIGVLIGLVTIGVLRAKEPGLGAYQPDSVNLEWVPATSPRPDMECWKVKGWSQVVCRW